MTADELAKRLDAKPNGKGWIARCPAHDDKKPSLSIAAGDDGRVLLCCHAGCSFADICAAADVAPETLFPPKPAVFDRKLGRIVATYDYTDAAGKLLFQVLRYDPKDFRQRRPDPDRPGCWIWNLPGQMRVLYRLPDVIRAKTEGRTIFLAEGEKDCDALTALGLCATCNPGGACKWTAAYTESLTGANIIILPDCDAPGRRHAALVLRTLTGKAKSVKVVELPDRNGGTVKDAADWTSAGGTVEELQEIIRTAPIWEPPPDESEAPTAAPSTIAETKDNPTVLLPAGAQSITETGRALGELLAKTERFFIRGGVVVNLVRDPDGLPILHEVRPAALASDFEAVAKLCRAGRPDKDGKTKKEAAICPEQTAKLIAASCAFRSAMKPIHVLTRCPVLIERGTELLQVSGYDRESGTFAAGAPAEAMNLAEAVQFLHEILADFQFTTPADHARALAALITPALVFGKLLRGRAPVDLGEADSSQTGKGYRNKLTSALYSQSATTITQKSSGVGGLEESFNMALICGANFIAFDNIRGKVDSPAIESFLTEDTYIARVPYRQPVEIDPRRTIVMMTSNKSNATTDLANRCACVRLLKQPEGHAFRNYPEGDILEHVRSHQGRYLGAVFAIVRAWFDAGKPCTTETRHDFRPWAQTLDWITQNLLDAGPLLDGHRETQSRMTTPVLNWLRDVALVVVQTKQVGVWLRASDILDLIAESGIETPGLQEHDDLTCPETRKVAQQAVGRKLGLCFRAGDAVTLDNVTIERREEYEPASRYTVREYRFTAAAIKPEPIAANHTPPPMPEQKRLELEPESESCGYGCGNSAAMAAANKTPNAANAANTSLQRELLDKIKEDTAYIPTIGSISRIAATAASLAPDEINAALEMAAMEDAEIYGGDG